jgi:hypothetical protein
MASPVVQKTAHVISVSPFSAVRCGAPSAADLGILDCSPPFSPCSSYLCGQKTRRPLEMIEPMLNPVGRCLSLYSWIKGRVCRWHSPSPSSLSLLSLYGVLAGTQCEPFSSIQGSLARSVRCPSRAVVSRPAAPPNLHSFGFLPECTLRLRARVPACR